MREVKLKSYAEHRKWLMDVISVGSKKGLDHGVGQLVWLTAPDHP
jgi:hypothetical protein